MHRRDFLHCAAGLAASAALADERKPAMLPVIDTHQHLWDLKKFKLPWVKKGSPLDRDYLLSDYEEATKGLNVVKTVYMEVDVSPDQQDAEADHVIALGKEKGSRMAGAVISGRPASDGFAKYVARFKDNAFIKGVRQVLHGDGTPAGYCLDKAFVKGVQLLGDMGKSYDICIRDKELPDASKLLDACPGTRFILDHCGNPNVTRKDSTAWKKDIGEVAKRKNVVCKVSGIVVTAEPGKWTADTLAPFVNHVLESFGPDRVMFGGDWPVCTKAATYRQWLEALQQIVAGRKEEDNKKLFHDNAAAFYGLK